MLNMVRGRNSNISHGAGMWLTCFLATVVKNPLSPVEHPNGIGVNNELFEESLEQFVVCD